MPALLVVADAPDEVTLSQGKATSWVQIGKTGKFSDPRYGKFSITESDFDRWIKNFSTLNKSAGRLGLPIDVDHSPEKKGETEAAGWLTDLEKRQNGTELWAKAEWNDLGKTLVADRRYAYISPSYTADYVDESGKSFGTALLGVALTNRPFLAMATVTLSKHGAQELSEDADGEPAPLDNHQEDMPELKKIALALGLSEDADETTILAKLSEQKPEAPGPINLDELAQSQGKVLMSADQLNVLVADAQAGRAAQTTLAETRFATAFNLAVDKGGALPADEETYKTLYSVKPDEAIKLLESAAERGGALNVAPRGGSGAVGDDLTTLASDMVDPLNQFGVDKESLKLHNRAMQLSTEHNIDYAAALDRAEAEGVR
jgi:phage I-like protein